MTKIWEGAEGRLGNSRRISVPWNVDGPTDEYAARLALLSEIPAAVDNTWVFDEAELIARPRIGLHKFRVAYLTPEEQQLRGSKSPAAREIKKIGEWSFAFDTTGGRERIHESYASKAYDVVFGRDAGMDDFFNHAIDVRGLGASAIVNGADVVRPALKFVVTARLASSSVTTAYAKLVASLTGKVNDALFPPADMPFVDEQWAAGEVLFLGMTGQYSSGGSVDLTAHFDARPARTAQAVGPFNNLAIGGHDVLWFRYEPTESVFGTEIRTLPKPIRAYVETVTEEDDLTQLFEQNPPP